VESVFDLDWAKGIKYREIFHRNEVEMSTYAFQASDPEMLFALFDAYEKECQRLNRLDLPLPAYDYALKCSHVFNLLDARGAISVTERANFIKRVRDNARSCAEGYLRVRERLGYPLLKTNWKVGEHPLVLEGKPASDYWKTLSFQKAEDAPGG
jgi:glycyl-tRNA synthetase alpha chain